MEAFHVRDFLIVRPGLGWHIDTATHVIRMILGGVFDRLPELQIVIGHMGEGVSACRWRGRFQRHSPDRSVLSG